MSTPPASERSLADGRGGRRKFSEADDTALLKEVLANKAHVSLRGTMTDKFEEVAAALNNSAALPWHTNGKHCSDRFKLLLANYRRTDRVRARASGTEEDFGEKDQLLTDILSEISDFEEQSRRVREESSRRDERIAQAGREIRENAMKRRVGGRHGCGRENDDEGRDEAAQASPSRESEDTLTRAEVRSGKRCRKSSSWDLGDVLAADQKRRADQEYARIQLETERLEFERERARINDKNEERRLDLLASQAELQRQQQSDNARTQMRMLQVMEEMMKKLDR
jgi:hypothetical protein